MDHLADSEQVCSDIDFYPDNFGLIIFGYLDMMALDFESEWSLPGMLKKTTLLPTYPKFTCIVIIITICPSTEWARGRVGWATQFVVNKDAIYTIISKFIFRFKKIILSLSYAKYIYYHLYEYMPLFQLGIFLSRYQEQFRYLPLTLPSRSLLPSAPVRSFWLFLGDLFSCTSSRPWLIWWSAGLPGTGWSLLICLALPVTDFWNTLWVSAFKFSFSLLWRKVLHLVTHRVDLHVLGWHEKIEGVCWCEQ